MFCVHLHLVLPNDFFPSGFLTETSPYCNLRQWTVPKISVMSIAVHYGQTPSEDKSKCEVLPLHATKTCRGSRGIAPLILSSALDGGKRANSRPGRFTLRIKRRDPLNGRMGGSRSGMELKKNFLCRGSNPGSSDQ
jgi:hypothetical protein